MGTCLATHTARSRDIPSRGDNPHSTIHSYYTTLRSPPTSHDNSSNHSKENPVVSSSHPKASFHSGSSACSEPCNSAQSSLKRSWPLVLAHQASSSVFSLSSMTPQCITISRAIGSERWMAAPNGLGTIAGQANHRPLYIPSASLAKCTSSLSIAVLYLACSFSPSAEPPAPYMTSFKLYYLRMAALVLSSRVDSGFCKL